MYYAMNRFKIRLGSEAEFENVWKSRDSRLEGTPGFVEFRLLRGPVNEEEGYRLFTSHSIWKSYEDFAAWMKSENFRQAHKQAADNKPLYLGPPQFEGFTVVEGA